MLDGLLLVLEGLGLRGDVLGESVDDARVTELQSQVEALRGPAGFEAVHGPAVTVVLEDAPEQDIAAAVESGQITRDDLVVHQQDIQAVVNALWLGGAEAMTLQDQRVISTTGIKCVGNTVVLHGVPYAPPYEITAIGDVPALLEALEQSEYIAGYRTYVEAYDLGYEVTVEDDIRKLLRGHSGQGLSKLEKHDLVDTGRLKTFKLFLRTREEPQLHMGSQHPDRVWIEGDDHRRPANFAGPRHDRL